MKTLYLVRHAKSSWKHPELSDFERPLNKRGRNDAPKMGRRLSDMNIYPDIIISSPANRAATTARAIAETLGYPLSNIHYNDLIYEASVQVLYNILTDIEDTCSSTMLIGHNPGLTFLANSLANYPITNLPTCGIYAIDLPIASWREVAEDLGSMKFFDYPKKETD
jgi:phosphohistidine phosphatase